MKDIDRKAAIALVVIMTVLVIVVVGVWTEEQTFLGLGS